jgi:hypothetical protein
MLRNITFAKVIHLHQVSSFCSLSNVKTKKESVFGRELVLAIFPAVIPNEIHFNSDINSNCLKCFFILKKEHKGCSLNRGMEK